MDWSIDWQTDRTACVFLTKRKKEGVEEEVLISDVKCSFYHGWPKNLKGFTRLDLLGSGFFNFWINSSLNASLICFQVNSQATYKHNLIKSKIFLENFMNETVRWGSNVVSHSLRVASYKPDTSSNDGSTFSLMSCASGHQRMTSRTTVRSEPQKLGERLTVLKTFRYHLSRGYLSRIIY